MERKARRSPTSQVLHADVELVRPEGLEQRDAMPAVLYLNDDIKDSAFWIQRQR